MLPVWVLIIMMSFAAAAHSEENCSRSAYSIRIIDESNRPDQQELGSSVEAVADAHFRKFIVFVSGHLLTKLGGTASAPETPARTADISFVFVRRPLIKTDDRAVLPDSVFSLPAIRGGGYLQSPWLTITTSPPPTCMVRAILIWNERQLLLDQAILSGAAKGQFAPVAPIAGGLFADLAEEYADSKILSPSADRIAAVSSRIPPDLLWLFQQSPQSTREPFSGIVIANLGNIIERASPDYVDLVVRLVDRGLGLRQADERYSNILNAKSVTDRN